MIEKVSLMISLVALIFMMVYIKKYRGNGQLYKIMNVIVFLLAIHVTAMLLQIILGNVLDINLIYYEYLTGCGAEYLPVYIVILGLVYSNKELNINRVKKILSIFPTIALVTLWTNDFHHLFYINYSTSLNETVGGIMFYLNAAYSYICFVFGMVNLILTSYKKSGFFSMQTLLIVLGCFVPVFVNILGATKIISLSVYVTPILFTVTAICFSISIFKLKAFSITPVAFRTVIDTMSDAYIVISDNGTIVDNNLTFHKIFKDVLNSNENDDFFQMLEEKKLIDVSELKKKIIETRKTGNIVTENYHLVVENPKSKKEEDKYLFNKYFEVDIHPIKASRGKEYVGTLLLFKDVTQHMEDMKALEEKQDVIVKQGQLVSIGELAGGVAHDINTPISAIKTGITMLNSFYSPRDEKEKELLERMDSCADKIIKIVNSMRNQIRNLGSGEKVKFKISDVLKDIQVITYNEITKHKCTLDVNIQDDISVVGEPTKLSQVFTNLIINAVQAYPEDKGGKIEVEVSKAPGNKCMIKIRDYAGGIPEEIRNSVFKNILTTKGIQGTGLGLYLAYSVIKGEFSGDITFESQTGEGTTFYIVLDRV